MRTVRAPPLRVLNEMNRMKPAFGLDLSGYASGTTGFARADRDPGVENHVTIYRENPFDAKLKGRETLHQVEEEHRELLTACLDAGSLFVDVPIDLQGLPHVNEPEFVWELTRRPVDFAFHALPPLADRIGAPVARFRHLLEGDGGRLRAALGRTLFETYPAEALRRMRMPETGYKQKSARYDGLEWRQLRPGHQPLATLLNRLDWTAGPGDVLSHDELDAAVCALTGVVDPIARLEGAALEREIGDGIRVQLERDAAEPVRTTPPRGYVLMQLPPLEPVRVQIVGAATLHEMITQVCA